MSKIEDKDVKETNVSIEELTKDIKEEDMKSVESFQPVAEVGVISSTTSVVGTVTTKGHVRIEGNVDGDISASGDIKITAKVTGDVSGENIDLEGCNITGDIKARGDVSVGKASVISGDMRGQFVTVDGSIEGNVEAQKGAHLTSASVVKGSISAPVLSMSSGAELLGNVKVSMPDDIAV